MRRKGEKREEGESGKMEMIRRLKYRKKREKQLKIEEITICFFIGLIVMISTVIISPTHQVFSLY